jgi:arsenical pump membrane protein
MHEALALTALGVLLAVAVRQPRALPEVVAAVPVVVLLLAVHAISFADARSEVEKLGPVVGFLAAVLVIADCCAGEGVFRAAGDVVARRAGRSSPRLLLGVVLLASVTTALLSLDTTVVLLTPVVIAAVRSNGARPRAPLYATAHLANSASLLLPVSNLTNLLAVALVPVSFLRFSALMALPWLVTIAVEAIGIRSVFAADMSVPLGATELEPTRFPPVATTGLVLTVIGFGVASAVGVEPVWAATAGALGLVAYRFAKRRTTVIAVARSTAASFCLFVLGLGVVVRAVADDGLAKPIRHVVPSGHGYLALLGTAAVAAVIANLINNLPATLLLVPVAALGGVGPVLAVLVGVNIGPNLAYPGSLATLLWRRGVESVDGVPTIRDFTVVGLATAPAAIVAATAALWLSLRVIGS